MIAPQAEFYPEHENEVWVLFDFRVPGTGRKMRRDTYFWKTYASIEHPDQHHAVMTIKPGGAREIMP